ncbi:putative Inositol 1,4,5-trisphosphate receptor itr-1 [Blattamonas nauphoetae]|uniref:Inositol 1,4,5-trisphosphate receptor itr-1 n=1 Tax=Blattamonas nauphoetae TaxID=2049346 RepID=A0ABQ9Y4L8_9EUKA|nr:putative Inositol 1,4,5-trisphosphate receptor itr-1 [Blattamonas nauphoetae]
MDISQPIQNQQANQLILEKVNESCQLGSEFILQFYNLYDANREQLKSLFAPGSHYFFRGNSFPNDRCDIPSLLSTLPPSKHDLFSFDSQPIFDQNYQWIALQLTIRGTVHLADAKTRHWILEPIDPQVEMEQQQTHAKQSFVDGLYLSARDTSLHQITGSLLTANAQEVINSNPYFSKVTSLNQVATQSVLNENNWELPFRFADVFVLENAQDSSSVILPHDFKYKNALRYGCDIHIRHLESGYYLSFDEITYQKKADERKKVELGLTLPDDGKPQKTSDELPQLLSFIPPRSFIEHLPLPSDTVWTVVPYITSSDNLTTMTKADDGSYINITSLASLNGLPVSMSHSFGLKHRDTGQLIAFSPSLPGENGSAFKSTIRLPGSEPKEGSLSLAFPPNHPSIPSSTSPDYSPVQHHCLPINVYPVKESWLSLYYEAIPIVHRLRNIKSLLYSSTVSQKTSTFHPIAVIESLPQLSILVARLLSFLSPTCTVPDFETFFTTQQLHQIKPHSQLQDDITLLEQGPKISSCLAPSISSRSFPFSERQRCLIELGVHTDLVFILSHITDTNPNSSLYYPNVYHPDTPETHVFPDANVTNAMMFFFKISFRCLTHLCIGNETTAMVVFPHFNKLLDEIELLGSMNSESYSSDIEVDATFFLPNTIQPAENEVRDPVLSLLDFTKGKMDASSYWKVGWKDLYNFPSYFILFPSFLDLLLASYLSSEQVRAQTVLEFLNRMTSLITLLFPGMCYFATHAQEEANSALLLVDEWTSSIHSFVAALLQKTMFCLMSICTDRVLIHQKSEEFSHSITLFKQGFFVAGCIKSRKKELSEKTSESHTRETEINDQEEQVRDEEESFYGNTGDDVLKTQVEIVLPQQYSSFDNMKELFHFYSELLLIPIRNKSTINTSSSQREASRYHYSEILAPVVAGSFYSFRTLCKATSQSLVSPLFQDYVDPSSKKFSLSFSSDFGTAPKLEDNLIGGPRHLISIILSRFSTFAIFLSLTGVPSVVNKVRELFSAGMLLPIISSQRGTEDKFYPIHIRTKASQLLSSLYIDHHNKNNPDLQKQTDQRTDPLAFVSGDTNDSDLFDQNSDLPILFWNDTSVKKKPGQNAKTPVSDEQKTRVQSFQALCRVIGNIRHSIYHIVEDETQQQQGKEMFQSNTIVSSIESELLFTDHCLVNVTRLLRDRQCSLDSLDPAEKKTIFHQLRLFLVDDYSPRTRNEIKQRPDEIKVKTGLFSKQKTIQQERTPRIYTSNNVLEYIDLTDFGHAKPNHKPTKEGSRSKGKDSSLEPNENYRKPLPQMLQNSVDSLKANIAQLFFLIEKQYSNNRIREVFRLCKSAKTNDDNDAVGDDDDTVALEGKDLVTPSLIKTVVGVVQRESITDLAGSFQPAVERLLLSSSLDLNRLGLQLHFTTTNPLRALFNQLKHTTLAARDGTADDWKKVVRLGKILSTPHFIKGLTDIGTGATKKQSSSSYSSATSTTLQPEDVYELCTLQVAEYLHFLRGAKPPTSRDREIQAPLDMVVKSALNLSSPARPAVMELSFLVKLPHQFCTLLSIPYSPELRPLFQLLVSGIRLFITDEMQDSQFIVPFIPLLIDLVPVEIKIEQVLCEVFNTASLSMFQLGNENPQSDERTTSQSSNSSHKISDSSIVRIFERISTNPLPKCASKYCMILSSLCHSSNGTPRVQIQQATLHFFRSSVGYRQLVLARIHAFKQCDIIHQNARQRAQVDPNADYHIALIKLLTAMCVGGFSEGAEYITLIFPLATIQKVITKMTMQQTEKLELLKALLSLMSTAYLDPHLDHRHTEDKDILIRTAHTLNHCIDYIIQLKGVTSHMSLLSDYLIPAIEPYIRLYDKSFWTLEQKETIKTNCKTLNDSLRSMSKIVTNSKLVDSIQSLRVQINRVIGKSDVVDTVAPVQAGAHAEKTLIIDDPKSVEGIWLSFCHEMKVQLSGQMKRTRYKSFQTLVEMGRQSTRIYKHITNVLVYPQIKMKQMMNQRAATQNEQMVMIVSLSDYTLMRSSRALSVMTSDIPPTNSQLLLDILDFLTLFVSPPIDSLVDERNPKKAERLREKTEKKRDEDLYEWQCYSSANGAAAAVVLMDAKSGPKVDASRMRVLEALLRDGNVNVQEVTLSALQGDLEITEEPPLVNDEDLASRGEASEHVPQATDIELSQAFLQEERKQREIETLFQLPSRSTKEVIRSVLQNKGNDFMTLLSTSHNIQPLSCPEDYEITVNTSQKSKLAAILQSFPFYGGAEDLKKNDTKPIGLLLSLKRLLESHIRVHQSCPWWERGISANPRHSKQDISQMISFEGISKEVITIESALSFIQQLCEGHNITSQNIFREQSNSSIDIIGLIVRYLGLLIPPMIPNSLAELESGISSKLDRRGTQRWLIHITIVIRTLTEALQGPCHQNQQEITDTEEGRNTLIRLFQMQGDFSVMVKMSEDGNPIFEPSEDLLKHLQRLDEKSHPNDDSPYKKLNKENMAFRILRSSFTERELHAAAITLALACLEGPIGRMNSKELQNDPTIEMVLNARLIIQYVLLQDKKVASGRHWRLHRDLKSEATKLFIFHKLLDDGKELASEEQLGHQENALRDTGAQKEDSTALLSQDATEKHLSLTQPNFRSLCIETLPPEITSYFSQAISSIEIVRDGILQRIYFPLNPVSSELKKDDQYKMLYDSGSGTITETHKKYQELCEEYREINHLRYKLSHTQPSATKNAETRVVSVLSKQLDGDLSEKDEYFSIDDTRTSALVRFFKGFFYGIGRFFTYLRLGILRTGMMAFVRIIMNLVSLALNVMMVLEDAIPSLLQVSFWPNIKLGLSIASIVLSLALLVFRFFLEFSVIAQQRYVRRVRKKKLRDPNYKPNAITRGITWLMSLFLQSNLYLTLLFVGSAIIGQWFHPIFHSILLFDIFSQNKIMMDALHSISSSARQLLMTGTVFIAVLFFFAVWATVSFSKIFLYDESRPPTPDNQVCASLTTCVIALIGQFPTQGEWLMWRSLYGESDVGNSWGARIYSFIYVILNYIITMLILFNILSGIIIDTFSKTREEEAKTTEQLESNCFVCGLSSEFLGENGIDVKKHRENEHDPMRYFHFYVYLYEYKNAGNELELNGDEDYMLAKYEETDTSFFPVSQTFALERATVDATDDEIDELPASLLAVGQLLGSDDDTSLQILQTLDKEMDSLAGMIKRYLAMIKSGQTQLDTKLVKLVQKYDPKLSKQLRQPVQTPKSPPLPTIVVDTPTPQVAPTKPVQSQPTPPSHLQAPPRSESSTPALEESPEEEHIITYTQSKDQKKTRNPFSRMFKRK